MKTFTVKCKLLDPKDFEYLSNCNDELIRYYNSMLNTLRVDFESKSDWPKECRSWISKYELQKLYSSKALGHKPKYLMSWQITGLTDRLFDSIKAFYVLKIINKNSKFPSKEKRNDRFHPLSFSFQKTSKTY